MGNSDSVLLGDVEDLEENVDSPHFVINFISATDIPLIDDNILTAPTPCDPYLRAYISESDRNDEESPPKPVENSRIVETPKRIGCANPIWDSYRDFHIEPSQEAYLTIELHHWEKDKSEREPIGHVNIPMQHAMFTTKTDLSEPFFIRFNFHKV